MARPTFSIAAAAALGWSALAAPAMAQNNMAQGNEIVIGMSVTTTGPAAAGSVLGRAASTHAWRLDIDCSCVVIAGTLSFRWENNYPQMDTDKHG